MSLYTFFFAKKKKNEIGDREWNKEKCIENNIMELSRLTQDECKVFSN